MRKGAATLETASGFAGEMGSFAVRLPGLSTDTANTPAPTVKPVAVSERAALLRSIKLVTGVESARAVKLYANSKAGMIGMVESAGTVKINGRDARHHELLWDGEIVQAPANAAAQLSLAGLGQVQLTKGSVVKLTTAALPNANRVLTAAVLQGEIAVKLQPEIAAYVEASGKSFAADAGSRFRVNGRDGNSVVEVFAGNVREIGSWNVELSTDVMEQAAQRHAGPRQYNIRPLTNGEKAGGYLMNVRAQSTQTLRFLVTDAAGKAAAGVPVVFTLNAAEGQPVGQPVGILGAGVDAGKYFETKTDAQGVAVVPFNAGSATGSTSLSAAVRGTNAASANVVVVDDDDNKFWTKRNAIPVFIAAGAAIVAGIVIYATREDRLPIQGTGPTQIVP
ncbi:MAG: FecR domain-containing protein [Acidobacteria bacterium]|nr:FecR domain-containing protein [Acidobacteriota bacterium]